METRTAWDLIGWDDGLIRIKGGRVTYEAVMFNDSTRGDQVSLQRIDVTDGGLRVVRRYVDPDTPIEPADEMAREHWDDRSPM